MRALAISATGLFLALGWSIAKGSLRGDPFKAVWPTKRDMTASTDAQSSQEVGLQLHSRSPVPPTGLDSEAGAVPEDHRGRALGEAPSSVTRRCCDLDGEFKFRATEPKDLEERYWGMQPEQLVVARWRIDRHLEHVGSRAATLAENRRPSSSASQRTAELLVPGERAALSALANEWIWLNRELTQVEGSLDASILLDTLMQEQVQDKYALASVEELVAARWRYDSHAAALWREVVAEQFEMGLYESTYSNSYPMSCTVGPTMKLASPKRLVQHEDGIWETQKITMAAADDPVINTLMRRSLWISMQIDRHPKQ